MKPQSLRRYNKSTFCALILTFSIRAIGGAPDRLDLEGAEAQFLAYQRSSVSIPGSARAIKIQLGDIKRQSVMVSITTTDGITLLAPRWMKVGDVAAFDWQNNRYKVCLDNLVNLLMGNDYATFTVASADTWERWQIERLIDQVERSALSFLLDDTTMSGRALGMYLREQWAALGSSISEEQFLKLAVDKRRCRVELADGRTVELAAYLEELRERTWAQLRGAMTATRPQDVVMPSSECKMRTAEFEKWVDRIRDGQQSFLFLGAQIMTGEEFARVLRTSFHPRSETSDCFDDFVSRYIDFLDQSGDDYQVRRGDGRIVRTSSWLKDLTTIAFKESRSNQ